MLPSDSLLPEGEGRDRGLGRQQRPYGGATLRMRTLLRYATIAIQHSAVGVTGRGIPIKLRQDSLKRWHSQDQIVA